MRSTRIDIYQASQHDRIRLYEHLTALGESIYSDTGLRDKSYGCSEFNFNPSSGQRQWSGEGSTQNKHAISIDKFIKKFPLLTAQSSSYEYKPGDKVTVIPSLKEGYKYDIYVNSDMVRDAGKTFTLSKKIGETSAGKPFWKFKENFKFDWTEDLFEPISATETLEKEPEMDIKVGDIYKNSSGNLNTITRVISKDYIYYTSSTGREYHTKLTIIEKNWKKVLHLVGTTQPTTTPQYLDRGIETGDYVERIKHYDTGMSKGSIWKVTDIPVRGSIRVTDGRGTWDSDYFKVINPEHPSHPNYTASGSTPTPTKTLTGFKPGDRVKVRSDLSTSKDYYMLSGEIADNTVNTSMKRLADKIVTIKTLQSFNQYSIEEENSNWVDEMFDGLESEQTMTQAEAIEILDTIKIPSVSKVTISATRVDSNKIKTMATVAAVTGTKQPTLKSEKKTMAKAIKETAMVTLDQNKQAAIIAGKMEAGRILNKQVLKQIKPHIPMFVRGYLDTPLAPVIVANLVAAVGNHTQNKRVQQVSELMLLAAADATVQSFNLDKIIDDVLAGVKLPAGILTSDEE